MARRAAFTAFTAPNAFRSMHGICTRPFTGSQVSPRWCSIAISAACSICAALAPQVDACIAAHDYTGALSRLAQAREAVDAFFDGVMVMADDAAVRENRLALLARLHRMMNQVADISRLSA